MIKRTIEERFWSKVDIRGENECWNWTASTNKLFPRRPIGYGTFGIRKGKFIGAHRMAYILTYGNIGDKDVCHKCDNPLCCNPKHLFLGTALDNVRDMFNKGRSYRKGEESSYHVVNNDIVYEMRKLCESGYSRASVSVIFGVDPSTVSRIVRGESWGHLK